MKTSPWFVIALEAVFAFGFFVLGTALFRMQVLDVANSRENQDVQTVRRIKVPGRRGRILDRNGKILADCRASRCIICLFEEFQKPGSFSNTIHAIDIAIDRLSDVIGIPRTASTTDIARHLRTASAMPMTVWQDIDDATLARFCEHACDFPGFDTATRAERTYPCGSLAAHVIGFTGRGMPDGAATLFEPELTGRTGVERFYNRYLAGVPGERRVRVNARGFRPARDGRNAMDSEKDDDIKPVDGLDLKLTLDAGIQASLERELADVTGAGVVLDPRNGAVLAMASAPTFNLNDCVPRLSFAQYASLTNAPEKRGQNRAISEAYAPGSTFKPITALAALSTGWGIDDKYVCEGVYRLGDLRLHCWNRWGHGSLDMHDALVTSCNTFFCSLGTAIGSNAVISAAMTFGLGASTGIDLAGETPGVVPDNTWKKQQYAEPWYPGDTCQMSIGQGMLLATPLQMAVVAAALGNGGRIYTPFLHAREPGRAATPPMRTLPFSRENIEFIRISMRDVVENGTGRWISERMVASDGSGPRRRFLLNVSCAGKTGTAEIGRGSTKRKNTWVIAFAPYENPTVATAMIVERGESGGSTVAPRVRAVFASIFGEHEVVAARTRNMTEGRD